MGSVNIKGKLFKTAGDLLREPLAAKGFNRIRWMSGFHVYAKDLEEVRWAVMLTRLPNPGEDALEFTAELLVALPSLEQKFGRDPDNWTMAPIRLHVKRFPAFPQYILGQSMSWACGTTLEVQIACSEICSLLTEHGFDYFDPFTTPASVAAALRSGGFQISRGRARALYDADVIEGKIDPGLTPFAPSRDPL